MKEILAAVCIFGFLAVTASAQAISEEESSLDAAFDSQVKSAAEEAIRVGKILCEVAGQLEDDDLSAETDEYFVRALWEKTKSAVKNATAKVKGAVKNAYKEAKDRLKVAAKEAKQKANEKALEIMKKIFGKSMETYALEDSNSRVDFVKTVSADIERVGMRLQALGKSLQES
uniref:Putative secreted protein n=1 Tax=Amblyomma triste TaxID=251400 RepID=A0A023GD92_AMBTT